MNGMSILYQQVSVNFYFYVKRYNMNQKSEIDVSHEYQWVANIGNELNYLL